MQFAALEPMSAAPSSPSLCGSESPSAAATGAVGVARSLSNVGADGSRRATCSSRGPAGASGAMPTVVTDATAVGAGATPQPSSHRSAIRRSGAPLASSGAARSEEVLKRTGAAEMWRSSPSTPRWTRFWACGRLSAMAFAMLTRMPESGVPSWRISKRSSAMLVLERPGSRTPSSSPCHRAQKKKKNNDHCATLLHSPLTANHEPCLRTGLHSASTAGVRCILFLGAGLTSIACKAVRSPSNRFRRTEADNLPR